MSAARRVDHDAPLLAYLFAAWPEAKKNTVREWLKRRHVTVNGRVVTQFDHTLRVGDSVAIESKSFAAPQTNLANGLTIRHEDDSILVVEKPAGLLSMASAAERDATAYALLTEHVRRGNPRARERVWIVHRLDRETSGLMVFARTEVAKTTLQESWPTVEKKYQAVVEGSPSAESGVLDSFLDDSDAFKVRSGPECPENRRATTRYRVTRQGRNAALLELTLETGRRHQIRVQLADAGWPIIGDKLYGSKSSPIRRMALHASSLKFVHPKSGERLSFVSPLPGEFGTLLGRGGGTPPPSSS